MRSEGIHVEWRKLAPSLFHEGFPPFFPNFSFSADIKGHELNFNEVTNGSMVFANFYHDITIVVAFFVVN